MPPALPVVRVTAPGRNVGKTLLASRLIEELTSRGYLVAAVKHSHHAVMPDREHSDTSRFARAGAEHVLFGGSDGWLTRHPMPVSLEAAIEPLAGRVDVAIVEGFKGDTLGAAIRLEPGTPTMAHLEAMDGHPVLCIAADEVMALTGALIREFHLSAAGTPELRALVRRASAFHGHRCAGITLGVRIALCGLEALSLPYPTPRDRLEVVVETARCATDAIGAVTGLTAGSGHLRVDERGIMAATFVDHLDHRAVRVVAAESARDEASRWAPADVARRHQQEIAYRVMPDHLLLKVDAVPARSTVEERPRPRRRAHESRLPLEG